MMQMKAEKTYIDHYDGSRRQAWVMPVVDEYDWWQNITDVPCPRPGCEGVVVWYEAGYVPGYRVCTHCNRHFEMGRDDHGRLILVQNGRTGVFPELRQVFGEFMRSPRPTTILDQRVPLPPNRSASVPQRIASRVTALLPSVTSVPTRGSRRSTAIFSTCSRRGRIANTRQADPIRQSHTTLERGEAGGPERRGRAHVCLSRPKPGPPARSMETDTRIAAQRVTQKQRMRFLPHYFGRHFLMSESLVYDWMRRLSPAYNGGFWEFYRLDNGGFYMAPRGDERMRIFCEGNGFEGEVSPDAAGIIACIFALNTMACQYQGEEAFANYYEKLMDFAMQHAEARSISAAID